MFHELTVYVSVFDLFLTQLIMARLSEGCKPDNFQSRSHLKLSFTNIRDLRSNFIECESFLKPNFPDILALSETNLDGSIDYGNFSVTDYLPLIRKDSLTHMHGLYARFFLLFHVTQMRFSQSTHLLMSLPLKTLASVITTG